LKKPVGRVKFERQLYNLLSFLGEEEEVTMTPMKQLNDRIEDYKGKYGMKSLFTKKPKRTDDRDGAGAGAGVGGAGAGVGGASAADSEDLRAHGYEVKTDVVVDKYGGTFEPFFKVWRLFSSHYTLCTVLTDTLPVGSTKYLNGVSTVRPEQEIHRKESSRGIERAHDPQAS
jgi:hypothetical protein